MSKLRLEPSIVALLDHKGKAVGTGFVVSDRLLLTCAHVVRRAKSTTLTIRFHINGRSHRVHVAETGWYEEEDVAVLEVVDAFSIKLESLPLASAAGSEGERFRTLGYASLGDYDGIPATGVIDGFARKGNGRLSLQLISSNLARGHSGAPIFSDKRNRVIGMVSEVYIPDTTQKHRDTAYGVPGEKLLEIVPTLVSRDMTVVPSGSIRLTSEVLLKLNAILLECGPFMSDEELHQLFKAEPLKPWRHRVPQANNPASRVNALVNFLYTKANRNQENALLIFWSALMDSIPVDDDCYLQLQEVIEVLKNQIA